MGHLKKKSSERVNNGDNNRRVCKRTIGELGLITVRHLHSMPEESQCNFLKRLPISKPQSQDCIVIRVRHYFPQWIIAFRSNQKINLMTVFWSWDKFKDCISEVTWRARNKGLTLNGVELTGSRDFQKHLPANERGHAMAETAWKAYSLTHDPCTVHGGQWGGEVSHCKG